MDSQETTVRLMMGLHNLNQMKKEIHELVSLVIGCLERDRSIKIGGNKTFESGSIRWTFSLETGEWQACRLVVTGSVKVGNSYLRVYNNTYDSARFCHPYEHIQSLYSSLPVFVGGMLKIFPPLKAALKPLIEASKANLGQPL